MSKSEIDMTATDDAPKRGMFDLPLPASFRTGMGQNIIVGFVCFCCPGMFNAMQGLGNAGGSDPKIGSMMNAALYTTFAIFGYFGGLLFNIFGNRILLFFGGLTYMGYSVGVYLWGQHESLGWLAISLSALLGIGAGCLWTAQGAMMMSYATEDKKGQFTSVFWIIFNLGAMIGGLITFGIEFDATGSGGISPVTYFTFCILMVIGAVVGLVLVVPPQQVIRADGKRVVYETAASPVEEFKNVLSLFTDKYMIMLTPMILQSNWFYTYDFGAINGQLFTSRTRGLNSSFYWGAQMVGAYVLGSLFLDTPRLGRRQRAIWGLIGCVFLNTLQWGYAFYIQFSWEGGGYDKDRPIEERIDFTDGARYFVPAMLYLYMGVCDSIIQTYAYWIMGAIANSPTVLARYAGYYKGIQSLGSAFSWIIDATGVMYRWQGIICFILATIMVPPTYIVASWITEHSEEEDIAGESTHNMDTKE